MIKTLICVLLLCSLHIKPVYPLAWTIKESTDVSMAKMTSFKNGLYVQISSTGNFQWALVDPFDITSSTVTSYYITPLTASMTGSGTIDFGIQQASNCYPNNGYKYSDNANYVAPLLGNRATCLTDLQSLYYPSVPSNAKTPNPMTFTLNKIYRWDINTPSGTSKVLMNIYGKFLIEITTLIFIRL